MTRRAHLRLLLAALLAPILPRKANGGWSFVMSYDRTTRTWSYSQLVNCHVGEDGKMYFPERA